MTRTRVIAIALLVGLAVLSIGLFYFSVNQQAAAQIVGYQRTADDRRIVVIISTTLLSDILEREAKEDDTSVRVTVRVRAGQNVPALGVPLPVVVSLKQPLAQRTVLDQNGAAVPYRGAYVPPTANP